MIILRQNNYSIEEGHFTGSRSYKTPGKYIARRAITMTGLGATFGASGAMGISTSRTPSAIGKGAAIGAAAGLGLYGIGEIINHIIKASDFKKTDVNTKYTTDDLIKKINKEYMYDGQELLPHRHYTLDRDPDKCHINLRIKDGVCVIILNNPNKHEFLAVSEGLDEFCSKHSIADYKAKKIGKNSWSIETGVYKGLEPNLFYDIVSTEAVEYNPDFRINILSK